MAHQPIRVDYPPVPQFTPLHAEAIANLQLERQVLKLIEAAKGYLEHSTSTFPLGSGHYRVRLEDAIATAQGHLS